MKDKQAIDEEKNKEENNLLFKDFLGLVMRLAKSATPRDKLLAHRAERKSAEKYFWGKAKVSNEEMVAIETLVTGGYLTKEQAEKMYVMIQQMREQKD